jgi:hypothetical protein
MYLPAAGWIPRPHRASERARGRKTRASPCMVLARLSGLRCSAEGLGPAIRISDPMNPSLYVEVECGGEKRR